MYNSLNYMFGGGIIPDAQKIENVNNGTVVIGLGGTGVSCLCDLKKKTITNISQNAINDKIKFLGIDTDIEEFRHNYGCQERLYRLNENEFLDIYCHTPIHIIPDDPCMKWLNPDIIDSFLFFQTGTGCIRQIGRLMLFLSIKKVIDQLTYVIKSTAEAISDNSELDIHIITGMCGGTGSGVFLDICYIIRQILLQLNLSHRACIIGYSFLPDVSIAQLNVSAEQREHMITNGFAAMKELDWCMSFDKNGEEWNQIYSDDFSVKTNKPPVDIAYLISSTDANGHILCNSMHNVSWMISEYIYESIDKRHGDDIVFRYYLSPRLIFEHNMVLNGNGLIFQKHGASYCYSTLGISTAYVPHRDILTYLTSKIFEGFSNLPTQFPLDADIDLFVKYNSLSYVDIYRELCHKIPAVPNIPVDHKTLYEQVEGITSDVIPQLLGPMRDAGTKISGQLQTNKVALLNSGTTTSTGNTPKLSLIERVRSKLLEVAKQADKGPYYSAAMLHNLNARDLRKIIVGYKMTNDSFMANAVADLQLREKSIENTLNALQNSGALVRKKRAEEYSNAVHAYYVQRNKINALQAMAELLTEFEKQLTDLYNGFFSIFATVMQNLQATFESNRVTLSNPLTEDVGYAIKLMTIQDLKGSLDDTVAAMDIPGQIHGFVSDMLDNSESWLSQDENKIATEVNKYFLSQLSTYTSRTIDDYLKIKFETTDPTTLQKKVYEDIIWPLESKATPMFWTENGIYSLADSTSYDFLNVPFFSDYIIAATERYLEVNDDDIREITWEEDCITFFRTRHNIPLFAYKGVTNYKDIYLRNGGRKGLHSNENDEKK